MILRGKPTRCRVISYLKAELEQAVLHFVVADGTGFVDVPGRRGGGGGGGEDEKED